MDADNEAREVSLEPSPRPPAHWPAGQTTPNVPATIFWDVASGAGPIDATHAHHGGAVAPDSVLHAGDGAGTAASPAQPGQRRSFVSVYAFTAGLALAAIGLVWWGPMHGAGPVRELIPQPAMFAVVLVLWVAASWAPVRLHYRGHSYFIMLGEVPVLLGLAFLSPGLLVLCVALGELADVLSPRKPPPIKLAFNLASSACCTTVIVIVYREMLGTHIPVSLEGWLAAITALCIQAVFSVLMVRIVMRLYGQSHERGTGLEFTITALLEMASILLALVILDTAWFSLWAVLPLVILAALIIVAY